MDDIRFRLVETSRLVVAGRLGIEDFGMQIGKRKSVRASIANPHSTIRSGEGPPATASGSDSQALTDEIRARVKAWPELRAQPLRDLRREFSKRLKNEDPDLVYKLALALLRLPDFEFRFLAYELVQHHGATLAGLNATTLEELGNGIDSWVAVDCFSSYLAGPAWREGQVSDQVIKRWAGSEDRWWRRAALVATVPLNNKTRWGSGDAKRTLDICRLLVSDRDDMVEKAMSWALRELAKRDPAAVKQFLREQDQKLAPRVRREVGNKLATGLKNPKQPRKMREMRVRRF